MNGKNVTDEWRFSKVYAHGQGMARDPLARLAIPTFGGVRPSKAVMDRLSQDIRHAFARLIRDRGFAAITIVTLALGIGANTAVFSLVKAALLSPLPVRRRRAADGDLGAGSGGGDAPVAAARCSPIRASRRASSTSPATRNTTRASRAGRSPSWCAADRRRRICSRCTRTPAMIGRTFTPADTAGGTSDVIVISHGLWQRRFGGDADIIGQIGPGERPRAHDHRRDAGVVPLAERLRVAASDRSVGARSGRTRRTSAPGAAARTRDWRGSKTTSRPQRHRASCRSSPSDGSRPVTCARGPMAASAASRAA